jgi:ATP-binding cassette, subfamily F, member 3
VVEVGGGRLTTHLGNYDEYLERKAGVETAPAPPVPNERAAASKPAPQRSAVRPSRKGLEQEIKAIKERLQGIETQISAMERRLEEIGLALADPDLYRDGERAREIAQARKDAEQKVAWLMKEWEDLSLQLAAATEGS